MRTFILLVLVIIVLASCSQSDVDMVFVKGGKFTMGTGKPIVSPMGDSIRGFTSPEKTVSIDDFWISRYEITVKAFRKFCGDTNRAMPDPPSVSPYGDTIVHAWRDEDPMLATWNEANDFARWAGGRLPTEAEWEYAAKGGAASKGYAYSGSDNAMEVGWVGENSDSTLHPVGLLKPNELGLYDMTGNVHEWVSDWYNPDLDHMSGDRNPQGPPGGTMKISKGVGWFYNARSKITCKPLTFGIHIPAVRYQSPVDERTFGFGFRIVKD